MCKAIQDIRAEGRAEGERRGKLLSLYELVRDGLLTLPQASARVRVTEEQFRKQMEEAGYSAV